MQDLYNEIVGAMIILSEWIVSSHPLGNRFLPAFWIKNLLAKAAVRSFRTLDKYTDSDIFVGFPMISDDCWVKRDIISDIYSLLVV